jgi:hypothetical protein
MNTPAAPNAPRKWRWILPVLLGGLCLLVLVVLSIPISSGHMGAVSVQMSHLKQLGLELRDFAEAHGGHFPQSLYELPPADRAFHDPQTGKAYDWLYCAGLTTGAAPETILAASPTTVGKTKVQRIVMRMDLSVQLMDEKEFQQRMAKQFDQTQPEKPASDGTDGP